jgi:hypothetical protein
VEAVVVMEIKAAVVVLVVIVFVLHTQLIVLLIKSP